MNDDKPKFNITIYNILPLLILSIILFLGKIIIFAQDMPLEAKAVVLFILFGFCTIGLSISILGNAISEDIDILMYIYAKIKYIFLRYILRKKYYKFKYDKLENVRANFKIKKEKEKVFPARQFLRYSKANNPVFANKFCYVSIDYNLKQIAYFNKLTQKGFSNDKKEHPINEKTLKNIFHELCTSFTFDTNIDTVVEIIKYYLNTNFQNLYQPVDCNNINLNKMSIAELLSLPGMNLGKANKIDSYRKKHIFNDINDFIQLADINEDDSKKLKKLFGNGLNCNIKIMNKINLPKE